MRAEEVSVNLEKLHQFVCLIKSWPMRSHRFLLGLCVWSALPGRDMRDSVSVCPSDGSCSLHPKHPLSLNSVFKTVISGTVIIQGHQPVAPSCPSVPLTPGRAELLCHSVGSIGTVIEHSQGRVKLPPHTSAGQLIFAWILHWNLKPTTTRKHLFSCPSMIKQVAPRHKEAEFPLGELFSFLL